MKKYIINKDLYIKLLNLCTLKDTANINIDIYDEDADCTLNLKDIIEDIADDVKQIVEQ